MKINKNWIVVAFCTTNTPYEDVMTKYLVPSLDKLELEYYIEAVESLGSWVKNVTYKPRVILNAMNKYPDRNIVSLDADAEVLQYPTLFDNVPSEYDFAIHRLDWKSWYGHDTDRKELLSGTMFIRNTEKAKKIVEAWALASSTSFEWEQKVLERILTTQNVPIYELPLDYCYILTLPKGEAPRIKIEHPVIVHHQVSRQLKRML